MLKRKGEAVPLRRGRSLSQQAPTRCPSRKKVPSGTFGGGRGGERKPANAAGGGSVRATRFRRRRREKENRSTPVIRTTPSWKEKKKEGDISVPASQRKHLSPPRSSGLVHGSRPAPEGGGGEKGKKRVSGSIRKRGKEELFSCLQALTAGRLRKEAIEGWWWEKKSPFDLSAFPFKRIPTTGEEGGERNTISSYFSLKDGGENYSF